MIKNASNVDTNFRSSGNEVVFMMSEWRQLSTITKVFYIGGLISAIGPAIMILTGMTSIGAMLALKFKLCPWCM
jgi:hypothetical protein